MPRQGSRADMIRSRFIRKSGKPGAKRRPKTILLLGSKSIGKTSLIKRFLDGKHSGNYPSTVEDRFEYNDTYNAYQLHCEIIDIDAFEFPAMRDLHIKEACIIMLLYEVRNKKSFNVMQKLQAIIAEARDRPVPIVVVATKGDKLDSAAMMGEVKDGFVDEFVLDLNSSSCADGVRHINTSAVLGYNVSQAFGMAFDDMIKIINNETLKGEKEEQEVEQGGRCCILM